MLLAFWNKANHFPGELIKDVLDRKVSDRALVAATESLGFLKNTKVAFWVIRNQLENSNHLVREAAIGALRLIFVRAPDTVFPWLLCRKLIHVFQHDENTFVRKLAKEILDDLTFENFKMSEYKKHMENTIELVGTYGSDETHALSAWTSTSRDLTDEKRSRMDKLLLRLASEGHETPFEKSAVHFLVTTEIATHIQLLKHRIGVSINGESARYKELKDDKFYVPFDWDDEDRQEYVEFMELALQKYHKVLARLKTKGVSTKRAKESARFFLPYGNQITSDIMFNWRSFMHFIRLRYSMHSQAEVRNLARKMLEEVLKTGKFDMSFRAFGLLNDDGTLISPFDSE